MTNDMASEPNGNNRRSVGQWIADQIAGQAIIIIIIGSSLTAGIITGALAYTQTADQMLDLRTFVA